MRVSLVIPASCSTCPACYAISVWSSRLRQDWQPRRGSRPDDPRIRYNQALLLLLLGQFERAWPGWEQRFRAGAVPARNLAKPRWHGEALAGRTLLIHAEQGLGDTIQFCRYPFPQDGTVIFEVQPRIARLLGGLKNAPRIVPAGGALPQFDLECPLMSLPAIRGTTEGNDPCEHPILVRRT